MLNNEVVLRRGANLHIHLNGSARKTRVRAPTKPSVSVYSPNHLVANQLERGGSSLSDTGIHASCKGESSASDVQSIKLAEEYLEWDEEDEHQFGKPAAADFLASLEKRRPEGKQVGLAHLCSGIAAAAKDVVSVGKTLVQLSTWTCTECEANGRQAARFDVIFNVLPGHGARLASATVIIRLEHKAMEVLELGPEMVQAKDPVRWHITTKNEGSLKLEGGHAPVANVAASVGHTSTVLHEGLTYPCRVKAGVPGLSYARCAKKNSILPCQALPCWNSG